MILVCIDRAILLTYDDPALPAIGSHSFTGWFWGKDSLSKNIYDCGLWGHALIQYNLLESFEI